VRARSLAVLGVLALGACARRQVVRDEASVRTRAPAPEGAAAAPVARGTATVVELAVPEGTVPLRDRMRVALAAAPVSPCYAALLTRDPAAYGEVVVEVVVGRDGVVTEGRVHFTTLAEEAAGCVVDVVRGQRLPAAPQDGFVVRYPYLFSSTATPPEIARAMRVRYGLEPAIPPGNPDDPKAPRPAGVITVW
jgi:hypothetical protein